MLNEYEFLLTVYGFSSVLFRINWGHQSRNHYCMFCCKANFALSYWFMLQRFHCNYYYAAFFHKISILSNSCIVTSPSTARQRQCQPCIKPGKPGTHVAGVNHSGIARNFQVGHWGRLAFSWGHIIFCGSTWGGHVFPPPPRRYAPPVHTNLVVISF